MPTGDHFKKQYARSIVAYLKRVSYMYRLNGVILTISLHMVHRQWQPFENVFNFTSGHIELKI